MVLAFEFLQATVSSHCSRQNAELGEDSILQVNPQIISLWMFIVPYLGLVVLKDKSQLSTRILSTD